MKKSLQPTRKLLQKLLNEALFNPREPGPMQVILETNNPEYFRLRAIELIRLSIASQELQQENLNLAIQLLLMARALLPIAQTAASQQCGNREAVVQSARQD